MAEKRLPGVNVGIWIPGRGTWVRSFGKADLATGAPMEIADHLRIASVTKTFTATAILQLVDAGKLSLDDTLSTFIEGIPNGDRITIRNLLGMTSGIYDFPADEQFMKDIAADPLMAFSADDVIAILRRNKPNFEPGAEVVYCDTNFIVLGVILEKVSGRQAGGHHHRGSHRAAEARPDQLSAHARRCPSPTLTATMPARTPKGRSRISPARTRTCPGPRAP